MARRSMPLQSFSAIYVAQTVCDCRYGKDGATMVEKKEMSRCSGVSLLWLDDPSMRNTVDSGGTTGSSQRQQEEQDQ